MGIEKRETNVNRIRKHFLSVQEEECKNGKYIVSMNEEAEPFPGCCGYYLHCFGENSVKYCI